MTTALTIGSSASKQIVSRTGKITGTVYYVGSKSASDLKELLKAQGHKGAALRDKVNEALRDESSQRKVVLGAAVAALDEKGFTADKIKVTDKTANISFVKVGAAKDPMAAAKDALAKLSPEQLTAMLSSLSAAQIAASGATVNV